MFPLPDVESATLDSAVGSRKTLGDNFISKAQCFENLGTFIALKRADPHLGHHLQHALIDRLAIGLNDLGVVVQFVGVKPTVSSHLPQRLKGQVRIDGIGTVADQQTMVMDFACFPGFDHDADLGTLRIANQVMMDGAASQQRTDGNSIVADAAVGEHHQRKSFVDSLFCFQANSIHVSTSPALPSFLSNVISIGLVFQPAVVHVQQRREFFIGQNRMRNEQSMGRVSE